MKLIISTPAESLMLPSSLVPAVIKLLEIKRKGYFLHPRKALDIVYSLATKREELCEFQKQKALLYKTPLKIRRGEKTTIYEFVKNEVNRYRTYLIDDEDDAVAVIRSLTRLEVPPSTALDIVRSSRGYIKVLKPVVSSRVIRVVSLVDLEIKVSEREVSLSKKYIPVLRRVFKTKGDLIVVSTKEFLIPLVWYLLSINAI